tara:strand:- start:10325 stop:11158 length:834 start_codon:yes stop_codon:yes gene_type:complete
MIKPDNIGWINGHWARLEALSIPMKDCGLKYGDGIFETILISKGKAKLLRAHLQRWEQGAIHLGMDEPPHEDWLRPLITKAVQLCSLESGYGALRLNWSRGDHTNLGLRFASGQSITQSHLFWLELTSIKLCFDPISAIISCNEKRNPHSILNLYKTFEYGQAIQAQREAINSGVDQALLENNRGELCCGTTSNIIIRRNNTLLTPELKSGCLPGIMRGQGIKSGLIKEASLTSSPIEGDEWLLINSLGCKPIYKLNNSYLKSFTNPQELWLSLYSI